MQEQQRLSHAKRIAYDTVVYTGIRLIHIRWSLILLVVDMTSRIPVVRILNTESYSSVLNALKGVYCDFQLPKKMLSNSGPCFRAEEFVEFHVKLKT